MADHMTDQRHALFLGMLAYETWASSAVIESLKTVPEDQTAGPAFTRALQVMAHVQIARRVWLGRVAGSPAEMPKDWFPAWKPPQLVESAAQLDTQWHEYLLRLTPAELDREVEYRSSEGVGYISRVQDILTHVFNHSTYHRGQVARLVTQAGGRRAVTDFIARTRRTG